MAKKEVYPKPGILAIYLQHLKTLPNIERKRAAMPYTAVYGHMFFFPDKEDNLPLRLPERDAMNF
jgi:hypothetical protein